MLEFLVTPWIQWTGWDWIQVLLLYGASLVTIGIVAKKNTGTIRMMDGPRPPRPAIKVVMHPAQVPVEADGRPVDAGVRKCVPEPCGAGYTFDPYDSPAERAEGCFVGNIANVLLGSFGLSDPAGFCSTYREWHVFLAGIWAGFKARQFADIPECPPLWQDEIQYYRGGATLSNVWKIYGTSGSAALAGVWIWLNSSGVIEIAKKLIPGGA